MLNLREKSIQYDYRGWERFYVRSGNYPFRIFLKGATESDMTKLFDADNETRAIDEDEVYPKYKSWVGSKGNTDKNWYK